MSVSDNVEQFCQDKQDNIESWIRRNITRGPWARILRMARKPSKEEFTRTAIICGIGLFVLGAIGFAILFVMDTAIPYLLHDVGSIEYP